MINVEPGSVAGYAWPQSVRPGESFALHLSSAVSQVNIEIARIGLHREVCLRATATAGYHGYPVRFTAEGCDWPEATRIEVGAWPSGFYEIVLSAKGAAPSRAFVVVRPARGAEKAMLLELTTNTWNAYNDVHNALNLYTGSHACSFQRPMAPGFLYKPSGLGRRVASDVTPDPLRVVHTGYKSVHGLSDWCGSAGWPNWEQVFVAWAERQGYELDYAINADLEDPDLLTPYRLMLSVGHDEYWSAPMRDTVESFISSGGNVAFLSGNTAFWQVRVEDGGRTMVGYKYGFESDPVHGTGRQREITSLWSDALTGRPENTMTGLSFTRGGYSRIGTRVPSGSGAYTIHRKEHWLLNGTGLEYGDLLGGASTIVGYECDGCELEYRDGLPYATGRDGTPTDLEIVATAPASPFDRASVTRPIPDDQPSELEFAAWRVLGSMDIAAQDRLRHGHSVLGTYTGGGTVVNSGSTDWVLGLTGKDPQVEQVTHNILRRLGK
ncbi:MAG TPA: N,N-dimethylformamidase beta subunit family domain-containing protein [Trebonia sp.]